MERESESRPLLYSFEHETWRSSLRKKCLRIPSEVTITGIILGLFVIVVTLLITLQNLETNNDNELTLDNKLLGSPYKYNKKVIDKTWQDKKDSMKPQKKSNFEKWNKKDKDWKISESPGVDIVDDVTEFIGDRGNNLENNGIPAIGDGKYGKEIDDDWELIQQALVENSMKSKSQDASEGKNLLQSSSMKWRELDDSWKKLHQLGWKDREIKSALVQELLDKKASLIQRKHDLVLQSSMNWNKINGSWKKNINEGDEERKKQESINDSYKNEFQVLKSSASDYKWKKVENGWKKLPKQAVFENPMESESQDKAEEKNLLQSSPMVGNKWRELRSGWRQLREQGWKDKEIKSALLKELLDKKASLIREKHDRILQSPMNLDDLWNEINDNWEKIVNKGGDEEKEQKSINDNYKNEFQVLKSSASDYKWKKVDNGWKKLPKQGDSSTILQSSLDLKGILDDIIGNWIKNKNKETGDEKEDEQKSINDEWKNKMQESPKAKYNKKKKLDPGLKKLLEQGWTMKAIREALVQALLEDKLPVDKQTSLLQSSMNKDSVWNKVDAIWEKNMDRGLKDKEIKEFLMNTLNEKQNSLKAPMNIPNLWGKTVDMLKNMIQKGAHKELYKKDNDDEMKPMKTSQIQDAKEIQKFKQGESKWGEKRSLYTTSGDIDDQSLTPSAPKDSNTVYNKPQIFDHGWNNKDLKEALFKRWKDNNQIIKDSLSMKWKKVNSGWTKSSNQS